MATNNYQAIQGYQPTFGRIDTGPSPSTPRYNARPDMVNAAPLSNIYTQAPSSQSARVPYSGGAERPAGQVGISPEYLHQRDHLRMQASHPMVAAPLHVADYRRIQGQAKAGCAQCQAFTAGAQGVWAARKEEERQNALAGEAATPSEQRLQRSLEGQIRRAGDRAVRELQMQPGETVNQRISHEASARAHAEQQVRAQWLGTTPRANTKGWGR